ncbi:MAG: hypothetical protein IKJ39_11780 [Lachnospiraceae bacterium]|nr:hypothetical protein [Lachnospiraceae bacterium]
MRKSTKWLIGFVACFLMILLLTGTFMVIVDPYFHYHKPVKGLNYSLENERYQNNGIVRHFDYNAIITGSSMTECFRPSELDELFGVNAIKVPYSGGSYKEVNENLKVAAEVNSELKMVVRCLDAMRFFDDKDYLDYTDYPTYLYDDVWINDVNYLFNKSILLVAIQNVLGVGGNREDSLNFDSYVNWDEYYSYGYDAVMSNYSRNSMEVATEKQAMTEADYQRLEANIEQNVLSLARENPQIDFYIYISPYSIYCMDYWNRLGELEKRLDAEKKVIELLLTCENIHVFSFNTAYDVICDANNYRDVAHHREEVNSQILQWMKEGRYEITSDNYEAYCEEEREFFLNYDYEALFQ